MIHTDNNMKTITLTNKEHDMLMDVIRFNRTSGSSWFGFKTRNLLMLGVKRDLIAAIRLEADLYTKVIGEGE